MPPDHLADWQLHLSIQASAAATLVGLVFVAASINLSRIVATPGLPGRVAESLVQFVQVLFIAMLIAIPRQSSTALALEVLAVALLSWCIQLVAFVHYHRARLGNPLSWLVLRMVLTHLSTIPFFIAACGLLFHWPNALYWLVPGFFFSFIAGLFNAWVLLIRVGQPKN